MKNVNKALALGLGAAMLAACNKEMPTPSSTTNAMPHAHAKAPVGERCYAIYQMEGGTGLALLNVETREMTPLGVIVDSDDGRPVDHFTGITYDANSHCTWLVTDRTTEAEDDQSTFWQIPGDLPREEVGTIWAKRVSVLHDHHGERVEDARDIEWLGEEDKIAVLRNTASGEDPRLAYASPDGEVVVTEQQIPDAVALTVDCDMTIWILSKNKKEDLPWQLHTLDYYGNVTGTVDFGTDQFMANDAGIAPMRGCERGAIVAVNDDEPAGMATTLDPEPHTEGTHVFRTFDMTTVREE